MKKIILLIAVITAYSSYAQEAPAQELVGFANIDYIISRLPELKQIETELKSTQTQLRNQLETRSREVEQQYKDFNANMDSMEDTVRQNMQRRLEEAMGKLEQMQQDAQLTLQNKQKLLMAPLYLKVNRAIAEVAQENGFSIILTQGIRNFPLLLYQQPEKDISPLVLKKFGVDSADN